MDIVFFGTSEFAVESLRAIIKAGHNVKLVVTQPDRKRGRSLVMSAPPVKALAESHGIRIYQPEDASSSQSINLLRDVCADLFVVVAFGQILKKDVISMPKYYSINLHGSLLPKYRGAAPTNWAIINGDSKTGVTVIRLNEKMDGGDVMASGALAIEPEDTNVTLNEKLADMGAQILVNTIEKISAGSKIDFIKQDPSKVTFAPKLRKEDGLINWDWQAVIIHNKVRGLLPWPGAYTRIGGRSLKILRTCLLGIPDGQEIAAPGKLVDVVKNKGMVVSTGDGSILITHVQLEGGKELDVDAFLRGHRLEIGYKFGSIGS
ncbi:MAG: methionyl-tRNA formyltransferase [Candidatus Omnitrophica bacterium]|nr:methionyl-tRNA formyltransferase [Candidatus Omnitrophota bacterium]